MAPNDRTRPVWWSPWLLILLLALAVSSSAGSDPSYTDCQPHIEATIRDLASKALRDGERHLPPDKVHEEERIPKTPDPDGPAEMAVSDESQQVRDERDPVGSAETHEVPKPEKVFKPQKTKNILSEKRTEDDRASIPEDVIEVETSAPVREEKIRSQPVISHEIPLPASDDSIPRSDAPAPPVVQPVSVPVVPQSSPLPTPKLAETTGPINKLVELIFGKLVTERDPKWSTPWQTHSEHIRVHVTKPSAKNEERSCLGCETFNKIVYSIFGGKAGKRDPKWTKPWQTHSEHHRLVVDSTGSSEKPVQKASGGILHKLVCLIFTEPTTKRDPKYAEPWQSHDDRQERVSSEPEKDTVTPAMAASGGLFDKFVRSVFPSPDVERDPKYSRPWQTHEEHIKPANKATTGQQVQSTPGIFNKLIRIIFPIDKDDIGRDPKWAEPWQTHDDRVAPQEPKGEKPAVYISSSISEFINNIVYKLFNIAPNERNPKWSTPWQTHEEHVRKSLEKKSSEPGEKKAVEAYGGLVDKFVTSIFGVATDSVRDPKYATPWQTHDEEDLDQMSTKIPNRSPPSAPAAAPEPTLQKVPESPPTPSKKPTSEEPKTITPKSKPVDVVPQKEKPVKAPEEEKLMSDGEDESPLPGKNIASDDEVADDDASDDEVADDDASDDEVADDDASDDAAVTFDIQPDQGEFLDDNDDEDDDQIILVPSAIRSRDHVEAILGLDGAAYDLARRTDPISDDALQELRNIYGSCIKPLETTFKYQDISNRHMSDAEIFGQPLVLLLGPYSTGKSTFLNYLMNLEFTRRALRTGANPSHGVFRIIQYGSEDMELDGTALSASNTFRSLQKFGQNFVDQLRGNVINAPLLKKVTFVEAPGILEMRRPGERQYPFNDVLQWFIDRADLVLAMFDYTKLDAGFELEAVLDQLKGREAQVRILLNKADQIPPEDLIKVQGSLFWNLSPLLGVSAPPTVYAGSFSSKPYRSSSPAKLFQAQEEALLHDIARAINARVENRVANARRHAVRVRNHAQMVDSYLTTYNKNKGFLTSKHKLAEDIIENPQSYNIYEGVSLLTNISRYDLPDPEIYRDFFRLHNLYDFPTLRSSCSYLHGCPLEQIDRAISSDMPDLLARYRKLLTKAGVSSHLDQKEANLFVDRQALPPTQHSKSL